jgi:putative transposase
LQDCDSPEDLFGKHGLLKSLTKRVVEHALQAELPVHLGYELHTPEGRGTGNTRNGTTAKTVQTATGDFPLQLPQDREGNFAPVLVPKQQRRLEGFDEKVLALSARALTTHDIQGHLAELYGVEVSPTLIAPITDAVLEERGGPHSLDRSLRMIREIFCGIFPSAKRAEDDKTITTELLSCL